MIKQLAFKVCVTVSVSDVECVRRHTNTLVALIGLVTSVLTDPFEAVVSLPGFTVRKHKVPCYAPIPILER